MADALPHSLFNGIIVPTDEVRISPFDRGFLFGDGIYEVVPVYGGKPLRLDAHFDRLQDGLVALEIANPYLRARWTELVHELIAANDGGDMGVYLEVSRGTGKGRDFLPEPEMRPTVFGFCFRLAAPKPEALQQGIAAATLEDIRWQRCDIKSVALVGPVMLKIEAKRRGADEAILVRGERLAEGSSSAVFVVKGGRVATPPASHERLPSITRLVVGDVLDALKLPLDVREVHCDELLAADEIWIASSTREALPVTRLDGNAVGEGKPGPVWRRAFDEFQALKQREAG
ncbi:MAG: D-amino acid aminotransferase [Rudaea sp.]|uniref:D-amino acid aminotransferase n=1 Tax=Rudaea sp. TaxID=2136325 RepID=UPI0039E39768